MKFEFKLPTDLVRVIYTSVGRKFYLVKDGREIAEIIPRGGDPEEIKGSEIEKSPEPRDKT